MQRFIFVPLVGLVLLLSSRLAPAQLAYTVPLPNALKERGIDSSGFSPKGTYLWVTSRDQFQLWKTATRQPVWSASVDEHCRHVVWTADEKSVGLLTRQNRAMALLRYDVNTGERLPQQPAGEPDYREVDLLSDGSALLGHHIEGEKAITKLVPLRKGVAALEIVTYEAISGDHAPRTAVSPDGKILATASRAEGKFGGLRLWNLSTGEKLADAGRKGYLAQAVAFLPDGKRLVTAHFDGWLRLWDLTDPKDPKAVWSKETNLGNLFEIRLSVGADGTIVLVAPGSYKVQFWSAEGTFRGRLLSSHIRTDTTLSADGGLLLTDGGGGVTLWKTGQLVTGNAVPVIGGEITNEPDRLHVTGDGKSILASEINNGNVACFDPVTGKEIRRIYTPEQVAGRTGTSGYDPALAVVYSSLRSDDANKPQAVSSLSVIDGAKREVFSQQFLADLFGSRRYESPSLTLGPDGSIVVSLEGAWALLDAKRKKLAAGKGEPFRPRVIFSPDGKTFVRQHKDSVLALHSTATGDEIDTFPFFGLVDNLAFGPEGRHLYGVEGRKKVYRINLKNGEIEIPFPLLGRGSESSIEAFAVSPKSGLVAVACGYGEEVIRVLDVSSGDVVATLPLPASVKSGLLAFTPDGKTLWAGVPTERGKEVTPFVRPLLPDAPPAVRLMRWDLSKFASP